MSDLKFTCRGFPECGRLSGTDVRAVFFENGLNTKRFDTVEGLLAHCKSIVK